MNYRLTFCSALFLTLIAMKSLAQEINVVTEDSSYAYLRDGKLAGPGTRVVEQMLKEAVFAEYRIQLYPWARAYERALREANVLIYPIVRTPAREPLFKWVGEMTRATAQFYRLRGEQHVAIRSLEDARQYSVGVVRGDLRQLYLQERGFTRLVVSASNRDNFQKLINHQVQLLPMSETDARRISREAQMDFDRLEAVGALDGLSASLYMAFSLDTPDDIVNRARIAFEQLKASGEVERLMEPNH